MQPWLSALITVTPQDGFALALELARTAAKETQPSDAERTRLRAIYAGDADALIAASKRVAIQFQTVARANND